MRGSWLAMGCILLCSWGCDDKKAAPAAKPTSSAQATATAKAGPPKLQCGKDWPITTKNGKELGCVVLEDTTVGGYTCAKMGRVELYEDGKLKECKLTTEKTIDGIACKKGHAATFYQSGKLRNCGLKKPFEINNVSCKYRVDLHENGTLRRCQISGEVKLGDYTAPADSWVTLYDTGKVLRIEYPKDKAFAFKGYKCVETYHYKSGIIKMCVIGEKMKYKGKELPLNTHLCFDEKGGKVDNIDALCMKW